jgi:hypothetical protein
VSTKFVPTQKSEAAVHKPMIRDFLHLPTQARYEIISVFHASHPAGPRDTARFLGSMKKQFDRRRNGLSTNQDGRISCNALAAQMRSIFPDLRHLSQATVWQCRTELELPYRPPRSVMALTDHVRADVIAMLENLKVRVLRPWPAHSPDLNWQCRKV